MGFRAQSLELGGLGSGAQGLRVGASGFELPKSVYGLGWVEGFKISC